MRQDVNVELQLFHIHPSAQCSFPGQKADPHEAKSKYKRMLQFVKKPKDGLTISIGDTIRTADTS